MGAFTQQGMHQLFFACKAVPYSHDRESGMAILANPRVGLDGLLHQVMA
jgi:hypothetical protein